MDPHSLYTDPDPAVFLNADPDPQPWFLHKIAIRKVKKVININAGLSSEKNSNFVSSWPNLLFSQHLWQLVKIRRQLPAGIN